MDQILLFSAMVFIPASLYRAIRELNMQEFLELCSKDPSTEDMDYIIWRTIFEVTFLTMWVYTVAFRCVRDIGYRLLLPIVLWVVSEIVYYKTIKEKSNGSKNDRSSQNNP